MMKNKALIVFLIAFLGQIGFTQTFDKTKLDNYFDALEKNNRFMGSVAVSKDGTIIYSKSIGFSDIENKSKANKNSKYRIGSISKTFTTVLVLKAIEENKLDLNQTIDNYFPTIPNAAKINIKHLLGHRSGIHNFTNDKDYLTWNTNTKTEKEMVEIITKAGSDFEPDSKAEYSNSNFVLLTYVLEKVLGKPYSKLLEEYITEPLGLKSTHLGQKIEPHQNECKSYSFRGNWKLQPETDMSIPLGAGGVTSTPIDLITFSDALFNGKVLKPKSLELMKTIKDNYGIGLFQIPFYDNVSYGHNGGIDGFSSTFSHFDNGNISYALTSNGSRYNNNNISIAVLSAIFNKPYDIPTFETFKVSSDDLDKYLGIYSSKDIPLKITITKDDQALIAQATGQPSFPLESTKKDEFKFDKAGITLEFDSLEKKMSLKQGGKTYSFTKENK